MLDALSSIGVYILPFLAIMTALVFFHELGHFLVGRWLGVKVDAFSIGFGPELAHFVDKRGTRWRLAALPLGGYVRFHGDANAAGAGVDEAVAGMPAAERAVTFAAQPVWKRAAIVVAGPVANFLLAIVIFGGLLYVSGREVLTPRLEKVVAGAVAEQAGFKAGDLVLEIDGVGVASFAEFQRIVSDSANIPRRFLVRRGEGTVTLTATPAMREIETRLGVLRVGFLGVQASSNPEDWRHESFTVPAALRAGAADTWYMTTSTLAYIRDLFVGRQKADQISGPAGLAQASGEMAKIGWRALVMLAGVLSVSIGLMNLMPIPLLDGGHLVFYLIEAIRGRALSEKVQEYSFRVGLAFIGGLMLFATSNDLSRILPQFMQWFSRS